MTVRVARIFNTFGPRMHMNDGRVVSNFILEALQNLAITVCFNFRLVHSCLLTSNDQWVPDKKKYNFTVKRYVEGVRLKLCTSGAI